MPSGRSVVAVSCGELESEDDKVDPSRSSTKSTVKFHQESSSEEENTSGVGAAVAEPLVKKVVEEVSLLLCDNSAGMLSVLT